MTAITAVVAVVSSDAVVANMIYKFIAIGQLHLDTGVKAIGVGPEQLMAAVKREMTEWGKLTRDEDIRNEYFREDVSWQIRFA